MATNLLIGYPELFFNATLENQSHSYSSTHPYQHLFHAGRAEWAELAAAAQFTNYLDFDHASAMPATRGALYVAISKARLLQASGVTSVVIRNCTDSYLTPSAIGNLQFWFDSGRNISQTSMKVTSVTERSANAIVGNQSTDASRPYLSNMNDYSNLMRYSEEFDNAAWTKSQSTVTANATTNPLNYVDTIVDKLVEDATAGVAHLIYQDQTDVFLQFVEYQFIVYAKQVERFRGVLTAGGAAFAANPNVEFNLNTGAVVSSGGGASLATVSSVGDGWYKISFKATAGATGTGRFQIGLRDNAGTAVYNGDGTSGFYIFGAQAIEYFTGVENRYQKTTDTPRFRGVNSNRAIRLEGVANNDNIDFGNPAALSITGDLSCFLAFHPIKNITASAQFIIDHENTNADGWSLCTAASTGKLRYQSNQAGAQQNVVSTSTPTIQGINIRGFVKSGTTVTMYNGASSDNSGVVTNPVAPTTNFFLGATANTFGGYICEVCVFNKALSAGERTQIVNYLTSRWSTAPAYSNHTIRIAPSSFIQLPTTFSGTSNREDIYSAITETTQARYWRVEFDTEDSSVRRCGHLFMGQGFDLGKDPIWGREISQNLASVSNKVPRNKFTLNYRGVTNTVRQSFESAIGRYLDTHNIVLLPLDQNTRQPTNLLTGIECEIEEYKFRPTEHSKNELQLDLVEAV